MCSHSHVMRVLNVLNRLSPADNYSSATLMTCCFCADGLAVFIVKVAGFPTVLLRFPVATHNTTFHSSKSKLSHLTPHPMPNSHCFLVHRSVPRKVTFGRSAGRGFHRRKPTGPDRCSQLSQLGSLVPDQADVDMQDVEAALNDISQ